MATTHCMIEARCGNFGAVYSIWTPTLRGGDFDTHIRNEARKIARKRLAAYISRKGFAAKRITTEITHLNMRVCGSTQTETKTIRVWN